jgi:hypothetical protein
VVVDDSKDFELAEKIRSLGTDVQVITADDSPSKGTSGVLWTKLAKGYSYALEHYNFKVLLRIDCDGLVIGSGAEQEAEEYFIEHPETAIIGSYKIDCNGDTRDFTPPGRVLRFEASVLGLRKPKLRLALKNLLASERMKDYIPGEHCIAGANFQSYESLETMYNAGYLNLPEFRDSKLSEDIIFSLMVRALGYQLGDFATGSLPMGLRWRGLPDSPENLLARNKKIIHSINFWESTNEDAIRSFFAVKRAQFLDGRDTSSSS